MDIEHNGSSTNSIPESGEEFNLFQSTGQPRLGAQPQSDNKINWKLLREACLSNDVFTNSESDVLKQKSPLCNNMLHIAASLGNDELVKKVIPKAPHLLTEENFNGDTALHVAAKCGHFPVLESLIFGHFKIFQEALDKILIKNKLGNTFFHEAIINGDEEELLSLLSHFNEVSKRATLLEINNEKKSGLYLAIEAGYKQLIDKALSEEIMQDSNFVTRGKSPLLAAILKQDEGTY
ncbi:protein ACCELERATED CELL DEATH 6-like [Abrus precatorius]|uniref:Protein ACCELERATED CELL DEATH 6-like n=1 Tax=Abrus precatorius TaxID=3816 RepID=A0A8B8KGS6_ABRPR|nr:protein ACCELERATED CELL DEATH 6-like [Abrus precatorius]